MNFIKSLFKALTAPKFNEELNALISSARAVSRDIELKHKEK